MPYSTLLGAKRSAALSEALPWTKRCLGRSAGLSEALALAKHWLGRSDALSFLELVE
jgi:hypothetical protein